MKKFLDAFNGIKIAFKHKSVIIQIILGFIAIIGGVIVKLNYYEWIIFIICIFFVIFAEVFNTSIEKIGDYLDSRNNEKIKVIKDLSSAAVLISAIGALFVLFVIVLRRFFSWNLVSLQLWVGQTPGSQHY